MLQIFRCSGNWIVHTSGRSASSRGQNRYAALVQRIFLDHYRPGLTSFEFERAELEQVAAQLSIKLPRNLGDVIYSMRYRQALPASIMQTAPRGKEWIIEGAGRSRYRFKLERINRIVPREDLTTIKVPEATPEVVNAYALNDEQALLARVRYNRLIDIFLGVTAYSLQNHLRTTVAGHGQIEIDEIYVAVDKKGRQYVIPVQAKGGNDQIGVVQTRQDIACCAQKYPDLVCRPVSAQFMDGQVIAMFELAEEDGEIKVVEERHYRLVSAQEITPEDLRAYSRRG